MSNHIDGFIGMHFTASIGEPWDFISEAGENNIEGRVVGVRETEKHGVLLLCKISKFIKDGKEIGQVVAVNRYKGSQIIAINTAKDKGLGLNFIFPVSGKELAISDLQDFLDGNDEKSFIVGTFRLLP